MGDTGQQDEFAKDFSFSFEPAQPMQPWDLSSASVKAALHQHQKTHSTIDTLIEQKRKRRLAILKRDAHRVVEEEPKEAPPSSSEEEDSEKDNPEEGEEENPEEEEEKEASSPEEEAKPPSDGPSDVEEEMPLKKRDGFDAERKRGANPDAMPTSAPVGVTTWTDLHLSRPLIKAVQALGYSSPTPIQLQAIPVAMAGKDMLASAVTGSGKTAAFMLPVLERLIHRSRRAACTRVIVIAPTRELAVQSSSMASKLAQFTNVRFAVAVGQMSMSVQASQLRQRPDVVFCTPGRLIDHLHNSSGVMMDDVDILVLDEADRLLELGFGDQVEEIVRMCPQRRQTLLFSATMGSKVDQLAALSLNHPVHLRADPLFDVAQSLSQEFVRIRKRDPRDAVVIALCRRKYTSRVLIFCQTKKDAHQLKIVMGLLGLSVGEMHGNMTQGQRLDALDIFRRGEVDFLVVTDVAARGLDIVGVEAVINRDMPRTISMYVHRVGRTARAGAAGKACSLVGEEGRSLLKGILSHAPTAVKRRTIPKTVLEEIEKEMGLFQHDLESIMERERMERAFRIAEMEADRAENLLEHKDEIYSRPKKIWFQSNAEKKDVQAASRAMVMEEEGKKVGKRLEKARRIVQARRREQKGEEVSQKRKGPRHKRRRDKLVQEESKEEYAAKERLMIKSARAEKQKSRAMQMEGLRPGEFEKKPKKKKARHRDRQKKGGEGGREDYTSSLVQDVRRGNFKSKKRYKRRK